MQNLSLSHILVQVERRGSSFGKLLVVSEQDDWVYSDGNLASYVAYILEMYKERRLFCELAKSIQATEYLMNPKLSFYFSYLSYLCIENLTIYCG
ncbi:hypothetical protein T459_19718 [Capsicum annuum]|uniref:Uncharacterized protein n=1 Tax=Capsicum annuum TaxID=4072 RepID=A0A2G2Z2H1_CAPAN|nr:hypothetical protein T459_19717 [Capsicum annuum]PHT76196.1 hypothetical protein T459_19718 [Capsicum annuum]